MGKKIFVLFLLLSVVGNVVAFGLLYYNNNDIQAADDFAALEKQYPLLSKRTLLDYLADLLMNFQNLRSSLRSKVNSYNNEFGLYFEYLPTGVSINVNGNSEIYAASLFKVPVIMAYYYGKERTHATGDQIIEVQKDQLDSQFGDLWKKGAGTKLKASEAVHLALSRSDNTAIKALVPYVKDEDFNAVYNGLDLDLTASKEGALITPKNYSSILKSLFFASILNRNDSEELLDIMSRSPFNDKLVAGIPPSVKVAHKIGDFRDGESKEGYRDCGIVYIPRRPYILCMYSTSSEVVARERMKDLSKMVYDYVANAQH